MEEREREQQSQLKSCLASRSDWTSTKSVLPLCLARYRPRRIIEHSVTKTTTATIPPIRAWSGPVCPAKAFGSRGRRKSNSSPTQTKIVWKIHSTKFYTDHPENRAFPSLIFSVVIPTFTTSILSTTQCCLYSQIAKALRTSQLWKILPYSSLAEVIKWERFLGLSSPFYNWKPGHSYL